MKKLLTLAVLAALGLVAVGCGPAASTKQETKADSNSTKKTEETKKS